MGQPQDAGGAGARPRREEEDGDRARGGRRGGGPAGGLERGRGCGHPVLWGRKSSEGSNPGGEGVGAPGAGAGGPVSAARPAFASGQFLP